MTQIEEIRARHETWSRASECNDATKQCHTDRAMLLAHVDRLVAELAEVRGAAAQILEDFDNYGLLDGLPLATIIKEKS